jgi:hypothetical protein
MERTVKQPEALIRRRLLNGFLLEVRMSFYCVNAEFYRHGEIKCCITESAGKEKPKSQYRKLDGMEAFKIWVSSESSANKIIESIRNGEADCDDIMLFYSEIKRIEAFPKIRVAA